jgi:hypothetical protein
LARNDAAVLVPVTVYEHRIRYKWRFAIPAAIILFLTAIVIFNALIFTVIGKATPSRVREYLFQLSAGRILTSFLYPGVCSGRAPTKVWIDQVGNRQVVLNQDSSGAADSQVSSSLLPPKNESLVSTHQIESR